MKTNFVVMLAVLVLVASCSKDDNTITTPNLQEYINQNDNLKEDLVIACAAGDKINTSTSYIFYYPVIGATDIRYFETDSLIKNDRDYSSYKQKELPVEDVFGGKLQRFVRANNAKETWSMVTYKTNGKLHKSNPIRLKQSSKPTEWTNTVTINQKESTKPIFAWQDGRIKNNEIYFCVLSDANNQFISGVYTYQKMFQYYNLKGTASNINVVTPPNLKVSENYNFTMMGVSKDNWVNLVIQKSFTAE